MIQRESVLACVILGLVLILPVFARGEAESVQRQQEAISDSRYYRTAEALHKASHQDISQFATTALTILTEIYIAEADLARNEAGRRDNDSKLMEWATAVDHYAEQLPRLLDEIRLGYPTTIRVMANGLVGITGEQGQVLLSHPRADQQGAFEHRVLSEFCARANCEKLTPSTKLRSSIPVSAPSVNPVWSFTTEGPVCSSGVVSIQFPSSRHLAIQRGVCKQFFQELSSLATEIKWQQRLGVCVNWPELTIQATPQRPEHLVLLNKSGDAILLTLPLFHSSGKLISIVTPWLQAKTSGSSPETMLIDASSYDWVEP